MLKLKLFPAYLLSFCLTSFLHLQAFGAAVPICGTFIRGDANSDGVVDLSDPVRILSYLFQGGAAPSCLVALDANSDAQRDVSDAVYLLLFLFSGGPAPAAPFPNPGFPLSASFAYVADRILQSVSVVDLINHTLRSPIALAGDPEKIILSSDGSRLYVSLPGANLIQVIDTLTAGVVGEISVTLPFELVLSPDNRLLYAFSLRYPADSGDANIVVIDTVTNTEVATIPLSNPNYPSVADLTGSPDGDRLYVLTRGYPIKPGHGLIGGRLEVIDTFTRTVIAQREFTEGDPERFNVPHAMAVSADGRLGYIASSRAQRDPKSGEINWRSRPSDEILVVELATLEIIARQATGFYTEGLELSPDGLGLLLNYDGNFVGFLMMNTRDLSIRWRYDAGETFIGPFAISSDGMRIYFLRGFGLQSIIEVSNTWRIRSHPGIFPGGEDIALY